MDCAICFCVIEGNAFACTDTECLTRICDNCIGRYIDVNARENQKLTCPREKCLGEYDEVSLKELNIEKKVSYRRSLAAFYKKEHTEDITQINMQKAAIKKLREERARFYTTNMPAAVLKVATTVSSFKSQLRHVKKLETKSTSASYTRVCFNLCCGGYLDSAFVCSQCDAKFCQDCELEKKDGHVCLDEAKQSVAYINSLKACPNCKTKIEKGVGCMAMTCAVCNTNFWYNTGEKGEYGNHGQSKPVALKTKEKLSKAFSDVLPQSLQEKLKNFEAEVVETVSEEALTKKASTLELSDYAGIREFSNMYSNYVRALVNRKNTLKRFLDIENKLQKGDFDAVSRLLQRRRFVISKILDREGVLLFTEELKTTDNLIDVCLHTKVDIDKVLRAIDADGIVGEYLVERRNE